MHKRPQLLSQPKDNEPDPAIRQAAIDSDPFLEGRESQTPDELFAIRDPEIPTERSGLAGACCSESLPAVSPHPESEKPELLYYQEALGANTTKVSATTRSLSNVRITRSVLENLPESHIAEVLIAYRERIREMKNVAGIKHVTIFKNQGNMRELQLGTAIPNWLGCRLCHARLLRRSKVAEGSINVGKKQKTFFGDFAKPIFIQAIGLVEATEHLETHCPFASRFPCETLVLPNSETEERIRFEETNDEVLYELAVLLQRNLNRLNTIFDNPPYNFVLHNCPFDENSDVPYRWHFEIYPRLSGIAGFEMGTDTYINPLPPEEAARMLREADRTNVDSSDDE